MAAGLGRLGIPPAQFWSMTPRELAAALGWSGSAGGGLERADLARLMAEYPDVSARAQRK